MEQIRSSRSRRGSLPLSQLNNYDKLEHLHVDLQEQMLVHKHEEVEIQHHNSSTTQSRPLPLHQYLMLQQKKQLEHDAFADGIKDQKEALHQETTTEAQAMEQEEKMTQKNTTSILPMTIHS